MAELENAWHEQGGSVTGDVTPEHIASASPFTGVPVTNLTEAETDKLLRMESVLHERVVAQDEAVTKVSKAIRRSRAGLRDPRRPSGSFIFLGPSGTGKTELAKTLAEFLFGTQDALITFDMSEYMEKHAVSKLVGAPPGYVGYDEGGELTKAVRQSPISSCSSTRSRRPTPTSSTSCSRSSRRAASPTARGARSTSATPSSS